MIKNTERFSDRVENYVKYRPAYPQAVIHILDENINFSPKKVIADMGSGTGISSDLFLRNNNKVYGVEPNKEMREAAEKMLVRYHNFISINGESENSTLEPNSVDLVVAAQSFHWFDRKAFRMECSRIAKPDAYCLLIWNERKVISDFEKAYEEMLTEFATDYKTVDHRNVKIEDIRDFFAPNTVKEFKLSNEQVFNYEGLEGRLLSSSYAPNTGNAKNLRMLEQLRDIYVNYQKGDKVTFGYDCRLFLGSVA